MKKLRMNRGRLIWAMWGISLLAAIVWTGAGLYQLRYPASTHSFATSDGVDIQLRILDVNSDRNPLVEYEVEITNNTKYKVIYENWGCGRERGYLFEEVSISHLVQACPDVMPDVVDPGKTVVVSGSRVFDTDGRCDEYHVAIKRYESDIVADIYTSNVVEICAA